MKLFEHMFTATLCLGIVVASRPSTKYLPPNFDAIGAESFSQYSNYHSVSGAVSRFSPGVDPQYRAALSVPTHTSPQFGHIRAAAPIPILKNDYNNDGRGNYNFGFETGNGIKRDESGHFQGSWPHGSLNVAGSYSYTGDDGKLYSVNYKADSNGFHAEGDHLPTPPPIPREIQETLHLHQHVGSQHGSAGSYDSPTSYSSSGRHASSRNFAAAGKISAANVLAPNANYLPPLQGEGYNYGSHH